MCGMQSNVWYAEVTRTYVRYAEVTRVASPSFALKFFANEHHESRLMARGSSGALSRARAKMLNVAH